MYEIAAFIGERKILEDQFKDIRADSIVDLNDAIRNDFTFDRQRLCAVRFSKCTPEISAVSSHVAPSPAQKSSHLHVP